MLNKFLMAAAALFIALAAIAAMGSQVLAYPAAGPELSSPQGRVGWDQITVAKDGVYIELPYATLVALADTNSMDPTLDAEAKVISVKPGSPDEIAVGDIVSYKSGDRVIIHRVIETGADDDGWFAVTKGDNNPIGDGKVRWEQVRNVVVGIIY
jgi:hypothetical protein